MAKKRTNKKKSTRSGKSSRTAGGDADNASLFDTASSLDARDSVVALHETAQEKYLNYALSVITSRALPDVRDGLKPVQRRILFTMWRQHLTHEAKHRKCAKVVGDVMGNYHPHGDMAIYDALVRLAQSFAMRAPMIDGSGNFGSLDGDAAAAMRYTESRLAPIASEMLSEIGAQTVDFRPNYDGTKDEPAVLPARVPNLLLNGATGIAVGMATNIPPHNLNEICLALIKLIGNPELHSYQLCASDAIQGPDFPTGGQILNTRDQLREIYKTGSGPVRLRGTTEKGALTRSGRILYITSVPYAVNKANLVEAIAQVVLSRKLPLLIDVKDISTDDVRIELTLKKDADEQMVLAYLYKHTPLQTNFNVNLTCLVPTENPQVGKPERCDLRQVLMNFLTFRLDVVTRRLDHELAALKKRIHILEGFALIFDALDAIIRIIRKSEGKADAANKIMAKFTRLDAEQTDAILELKLYRLAKLEVNLIVDELKNKKAQAAKLSKLLKDESGRWRIVHDEIEQIRKQYGQNDKRRSIIEAVTDEPEFSADDFIVEEDNLVILTRDGWVKRQKDIRDPAGTRLREGDGVLTAQAGSTRATMVFFSNYGSAYTCRIADVPATTGYGEPIQKLFKLKDGEKMTTAYSLDPRSIGEIAVNTKKPDQPPKRHALAASSDGYALRFNLEQFVEPSTRNGRRFARLKKETQIIGVQLINGSEVVLAATRCARAMICKASEVNYLAGAGRGVTLIKLAKDDELLGFKASQGDRDLLRVETNQGAQKTISTAKYRTTSRGGKGVEIQKRGRLTHILPDDPDAPVLLET